MGEMEIAIYLSLQTSDCIFVFNACRKGVVTNFGKVSVDSVRKLISKRA